MVLQTEDERIESNVALQLRAQRADYWQAKANNRLTWSIGATVGWIVLAAAWAGSIIAK